jgi:PAS domain S-box-containing protein
VSLSAALRSRPHPIPAVAGAFSLVVGILVLLGWAVDSIPLKSLVPGLISMKPNAALGFVLIGGALWFSSSPERTRAAPRMAKNCAFAATIIGVLTIMEYLLGWNPGFDQWLFRESFTTIGPGFPGRMGLNTALCFSLFAGAILLDRNQAVRSAFPRESLTLSGILLAFIALLGHLYQEELLYGIGQYTAMALHTSLTLLVVGMGILFLHPDRGVMAVVMSEQAGGHMLRRLLPGVLVLLPAIGWVRLVGERRGLYEQALGVAIFATLATVCLIALLWWTARSLNFTAQAHDLARQAGNESERRFRQLAESIREVFWLSDPEKNQVLYISPGYEAIWGRSCDSLYVSPKSWVQAIHPDDRERVWHAATTKQSTGTYDEEYRIITPDGSVRWIHDRAFPVLNDQGQLYRIAGIAEDVTENKLTREALRESEERFEKAFRSSPHPVVVTELERRTCLDANDAYLALFGFRREEVLGTSTLDLQIWPSPDDRAHFVQLLRSRRAVRNLEVTLRTKQGELRQFLCSSELIDLKGTLCIVTVGNDITDRKRAEEALRRAHVELEQRVRERTAQLAELNAVLEEQLVERERAEHALRASEERFRAFLDHAPNLAFVKGADGRYLYVNRRFEEVFHFERGSVLDKTDIDLFPREQAEQFQGNDRQVLASGEAKEFEEHAWHADGLHTSIVVKFPLRDASGQVSAIAGIVTDITDRKRTEEELAERARLSSFAAEVSSILNREMSTEDILRHCADTVVHHLGAAFARIWTVAPGDLCGTCFKADWCTDRTRCLHLKASAGLSTNLNGEYRRVPFGALKIGRIAQGMGVMSTNNVLEDERLPNKDWLRAHGLQSFAGFPLVIEGEVFGVMAVFARVPLSEPTLRTLESACNGIAATIARKQAEEQVRTSESFLSSVLDHLPNMVFVKDAKDLRFVRFNKAGEELLGRSRDELIGKSDYDFFPKEQADFFTDKDRTVIESRRLLDIPDEPIQTTVKGLRHLHTKKLPLYDDTGQPKYLVGISEDITDRKQAEEELRSAYRQLRDLTHRLETARETERQRIARELHDEFGQALTGMKLDLSWLGTKLARLLPTVAGKPLVKKTQGLMASVDALIDSVRETATSLRPGMLDDLGLIPALEWLTKDFSRKTGIACEVDIGPGVTQAQLSDESSTALFRIVQELLTNVIRHAQASAVHVRLSETDELLLLELTDNGTGISPHRITQSGSLGLRGMQERATLLGGSFTIRGSPGIGTTATIALPKSSLLTSPEEKVR